VSEIDFAYRPPANQGRAVLITALFAALVLVPLSVGKLRRRGFGLTGGVWIILGMVTGYWPPHVFQRTSVWARMALQVPT
jgi:hypothetical protein